MIPTLLKGHQIIGELRPAAVYPTAFITLLKGHQIIGELRPATTNARDDSSN